MTPFAVEVGSSAPLERRVIPATDATEVLLFERALISIVDDDHAFRDSMRRLIKSLGYAVAVFPCANEFLASPRLAATACLVADVQMPAMTGIQLFTHLIEIGHAIPTILVTAYPDESDQQRMVTLGVQCYLRKPFEETDLIGCLRSALARRKAPRDPP
jgi:FixJ family two-component response regulator